MREVLLRVMLMLLLGAFYFNLISFPQFIIGLVFVHAVPLAGLVMLARSTEGFFISTKWSVFSRKDYKEIVHYSWYHMLTGVSLNLLSFVDVLLLGPLSKSGFADVAVYTTAQFFIAIMVVPYRAMAGAAFPKLNDAWIRSDHSALASLFNRAGLNMLIVAAAMWLLVCCNLQNFVTFFPPAYAALVPVVLILSIGRLVDMSTGLNTELISVTNYYKFNFRMSVILLVAVVILDRIFIPKAGIYGAAWVASMTLVAFNIVKMIYLYRKTGLQPFSKSSMLVLAAGVAAFVASLLLPALENRFADIFIRSAVIMLTYTIILILLRPSPDLSEFLVQLRRNKRLF
jgi:O-antigen/teichoic acid export membrane protein